MMSGSGSRVTVFERGLRFEVECEWILSYDS